MALINEKKKSWLDQVKEDAAKITRQRLNESINDHERKEFEINTREGVTEGTPVRQAALINPSEPDLENFVGGAESTLSGEKPSVSKQANAPSNQIESAPSSSSTDSKSSKSSK